MISRYVNILWQSTARAMCRGLTVANLAQQWEDLEVLDVPSCARGAIRGRRPGTVSHGLSVIDSSSLSLFWITRMSEYQLFLALWRTVCH